MDPRASNGVTEIDEINRFWGLHDVESCVAVAVNCWASLVSPSVRSVPGHFGEETTALKAPMKNEVVFHHLESSVQDEWFS